MRSVAKLTRRFVGILSLSTLLLLAVNLVILVVLAGYIFASASFSNNTFPLSASMSMAASA